MIDYTLMKLVTKFRKKQLIKSQVLRQIQDFQSFKGASFNKLQLLMGFIHIINNLFVIKIISITQNYIKYTSQSSKSAVQIVQINSHLQQDLMKSLNPQIQNIKSVESEQQESCLFCMNKQSVDNPSTNFYNTNEQGQFVIQQQTKKSREKIDLFLKLNRAIGKKYKSKAQYHYTNAINTILGQNEQEHHEYYSHPIVINYKQTIMAALNDRSQEMKKQIKFYNSQLVLQHIVQRGQFYKFHTEVPRIHTPKIQQIMAKYHDKKRAYDYQKVKEYLNKEKGISISSLSQSSFYGDQSKQQSQQQQQSIKKSNFLEQLNKEMHQAVKIRKNKNKSKQRKNKKKTVNILHNVKPKAVYQVKTVDTSDSILLMQICKQIENNQNIKQIKKQWSIDQGNYYFNPQHFQKYLMRQQVKQKNRKLRNQKYRKQRIYRKIVQRQNPYNNYHLMLELKVVKKNKKKTKIPNKFRYNNVQIVDKQINSISKNIIGSQQLKRSIQISPYDENIIVIPGQNIFSIASQSARGSRFRIKQNTLKKQDIKSSRPLTSIRNRKTKEDQNQLTLKKVKRTMSVGTYKIKTNANKALNSLVKNTKNGYSSFKQFLAAQKRQLQTRILNLQANKNLNTKKGGLVEQKQIEKCEGSSLLNYKSSDSIQKAKNYAIKTNGKKKTYIQQIIDRKLTIYDRNG